MKRLFIRSHNSNGDRSKKNGWVSRLIVGIVMAIIGGLVGGLLVPHINSCLSGEKEIRRIIDQEASLVLAGKIEEVVSLFDENAYVRDAAGGDTGQEIVWKGREEIANRYRNLPQFNDLKHDAIEITISSDKEYARAVADTIGEYVIDGKNVRISSNRGEKWVLEKVGGKWMVTSFTYNLP